MNSILVGLTKPTWREVLRESTLRGLVRTIAGLEKDLSRSSEYPQLAKMNSQHNEAIASLLALSLAAAAYAKDECRSNLVKFKAPLQELEPYKNNKFQAGSAINFDAELVILQALMRQGPCGVLTVCCPKPPRNSSPRASMTRNPPIGHGGVHMCINHLGLSFGRPRAAIPALGLDRWSTCLSV